MAYEEPRVPPHLGKQVIVAARRGWEMAAGELYPQLHNASSTRIGSQLKRKRLVILINDLPPPHVIASLLIFEHGKHKTGSREQP
jgi:precorrin-6B methylase 1